MDADVVIIGAGFAGAAAAVKLRQAGRRVVILEAQDRVGGRAFARGFANSKEQVEFGGAWIAPWQTRIRHHAKIHGVDLHPAPAIIEHRFHDGMDLRSGQPCSQEAWPAFARSLERIRTDAHAYEAGDRRLVSVSLNRYLDMIHASPEARVHVMAWWTISGNGDPERISAAEFLSSCAYGGGAPEGMITVLRHTLVPSAGELVARMIARSGATLRLGTPVALIEQDAGSVRINGLTAGHAIVCVPLNVIHTIAFDPPLPRLQLRAAGTGHGGIALKVWIKAQGVKPGTLATGGGSGLQWMLAERAAPDGSTLIVAFGLDDGSFEPRSRGDVADALHRFFPGADLVAWDWHDWVKDPWARGTWVAAPADSPSIADCNTWAQHGRVAFACADFAPQSPGWFEAAIVSGERAADVL